MGLTAAASVEESAVAPLYTLCTSFARELRASAVAVCVIVAAACVVGAPTSALAETVPLPAGASGDGDGLRSVSCVTASSCAAVGAYEDTAGYWQGLLLTAAGGAWTANAADLSLLSDAASANPDVNLATVSCGAAESCAAAGTYIDSGLHVQGLVLTDTLGSWTAATAPLPSGASANPDAYVTSVSCGSAATCTAVGDYFDSEGEEGLLLTEQDGVWTATKAPLPSGSNANEDVILNSVSCSADGSCVAVGNYYDDSDRYEGLVLTETGGAWTVAEAPVPGDAATNPYVELESVSCASSGSCIAVGDYYAAGEAEQGLVLTETGGAWTAAEAPLPSDAAPEPGVELDSSTCPSDGHCVAVGEYYDSGGNGQGLLLSEQDGVWAAAEAPLPAGAGTEQSVHLDAVSCTLAGSCTAVGNYQDRGKDRQGLLLTDTYGDDWSATEAPLPTGGTAPNPNAYVPSTSCAAAGYCVVVGAYEATLGLSRALLFTPPGASVGVSATPGSGEATIGWSAPVDDGGLPITGYTVTATDSTDAARGGQVAMTAAPGATLTGLTPGDSYTFTVSANSLLGVGVGATSSAVTIPTPTPSPPATGPQSSVSAKQIVATLAKVIAPSGKQSRLRRILVADGYSFRYTALEAGRLTVRWYHSAKKERGKGARRHRAKLETLVANASVAVASAQTVDVRVKLTRRGKRLLRRHRRLEITAELSFTPSGGEPVKRARSFTLK